MALALHAPELIQDLVSVDNAPVDVALLSEFPKYIQGMKKIEEAEITKQAEADNILQDYEESLPIRQFLLGNLHRRPNEKSQKFKVPLHILGSSLGNLGDFPFKDPEAVRFEKRALFIRGTKSKYIPDEALPIIGRFFPRFELEDIDSGHWVISEKPEEFRRGNYSEAAILVAPLTHSHSRFGVSHTQGIECVQSRIYNSCIIGYHAPSQTAELHLPKCNSCTSFLYI